MTIVIKDEGNACRIENSDKADIAEVYSTLCGDEYDQHKINISDDVLAAYLGAKGYVVRDPK